MSRMLSKMNLISVVQQLPKEDIETIQGYVEMIEQENQKLETEKEQLNSLVNSCQEEIRRLKKQLEEHKIQYFKDTGIQSDKILELENQQKEFIEYLEYKLCIANKVLDKPEEDEEVRGYVLARKFMLEEILSKYKEIIGGIR